MSKKTPTRLGDFVLERMLVLGMTKQADLARASGIGESTISRLIYTPNFMPDRVTLRRLAAALRVDERDLVLFVYELGTGPAATVDEVMHSLASEAARILASDSPLTAEERSDAERLYELINDRFRTAMRRRSA